MVTATMQSALGKPALLLLLLCVVYHGAYGLFSVVTDFVASRWLKAVVTVLIVLTAVTIGGIGVKEIVGA
jgi:succinate dehydrogenase hydrophobic anchor subunit